MKELNDEIKLTLKLMQTDIDDDAHGELWNHLHRLLDIKRNELQKRLDESWSEPVEPLTIDELKTGGWWCKDVSSDCAIAFESKGLRVFNSSEWGDDSEWGGCSLLSSYGRVTRGFTNTENRKQIKRVGYLFYWDV